MTDIEWRPIDDLVSKRDDLDAEIRAEAEGDEMLWLVIVDIEDEDGETIPAIRCPRCGEIVGEDELYVVDVAERETEVYELDFDAETACLDSDSDADWGETIFMKHGNSPGHAVALPDGWTEDWR